MPEDLKVPDYSDFDGPKGPQVNSGISVLPKSRDNIDVTDLASPHPAKQVFDQTQQMAQNPDRTAEVMRLAEKARAPLGDVAANLPKYQLQEREPDWQKWNNLDPTVQAHLMDPGAMPISYDDTDNLNLFANTWKAWKKGWQSGGIDAQIAQLRQQQMDGDNSLETQQKILDLKGQRTLLGDSPQGQGVVSKNLYEGAESGANLTSMSVPMMREGAKYAGAGMAMGAGIAAATGPGALVDAGPLVAGGGFMGYRIGSAAASMRFWAGSAYDEYVDLKDKYGDPIDPDAAKLAARLVGVANAGAELAALKPILKTIPGIDKIIEQTTTSSLKQILQNRTYSQAFLDVAKKYAGGVTAGTMTNMIQEGFQALGEDIAKVRSGQQFDESQQTPWGKAVAGAPNVAKGLAFTMLPGAAIRMTTDLGKAQRSQTDINYFNNMMDTAGTSKTLERLPSSYQAFINRLKQDGPADTVYVDKNAFYQTFGGDTDTVLKNLNATDDPSGWVQVPIEKFVSGLAGTPAFDKLRNDVKVREDMWTANESKEQEQFFQSWVQEQKTKAQDLYAQHADWDDKSTAVYDSVKQQLLMSKRFDAPAAEKYALLWKYRALAAAAESGGRLDPMSWYSQQGLEVRDSKYTPASSVPSFHSDPAALQADIAQRESSNRPDAHNGINDEFGTGKYQFQQGTWDRAAQMAGRSDLVGQVPREVGEADQDAVAKAYIGNLLQRYGGNGDLVNAAWYAGEGYADKLHKVEQMGMSYDDALHKVDPDTGEKYLPYDPRVKQNGGQSPSVLEYINNSRRNRGEGERVAGGLGLDGKPIEGGIDTSKPSYLEPGTESKLAMETPTYEVPKSSDLPKTGVKETDELFQSAWHGSPHDFDQFLLQKIGSGEGAQAYGWGLYFASDKKVAEWYRNRLADSEVRYKGKTLSIIDIAKDYAGGFGGNSQAEAFHNVLVDEAGGNLDNMKAGLEKRIKSIEAHPSLKNSENFSNYLQLYKDTLKNYKSIAKDFTVKRLGSLYNVDIKADPHKDFLDWDKPLDFDDPKNDGVTSLAMFMQHILGHDGEANPEAFPSWLVEGKPGRYFYNLLVKTIRDYQASISGAEKKYSMGYTDTPQLPPANEKFGVGGNSPEEMASRLLNDFGVKGIQYLDGNSRSGKKENHNYVVFDDKLVDILDKYYQKGKDQNRGSVTKSPGTNIMRLFEGADKTTFIHESGHIFLKDLLVRGLSTDATDVEMSNLQAIQKYLGWKDGQTDFTTEQHEKFAKSFESYCMTGEAPRPELKQAFRSFKSWILNVYKNLLGLEKVTQEDVNQQALGVSITPEVKEFFDRMLASDQVIDEAMDITGQGLDMKSVRDSGADTAEVEKMLSMVVDTTQTAKEKLLSKLLSEIRPERKKQYEEAYGAERERIAKEMQDEPLYRAAEYLRENLGLPEGSDLVANVKSKRDESARELTLTALKDPKNQGHLDVAAQMAGVQDSSKLLSLLQRKKGFTSELLAQVQAAMREKHPSLLDVGIRQEAENLLKGPKYLEFISLQAAILRRKLGLGDVAPDQKMIKQTAKEAQMQARIIRNKAKEYVQGLKYNAVQSISRYFAAEQTAQRRADQAILAGKYNEAAMYRNQQAVNHALAMESIVAKREADNERRYLDKLLNRGKKNFGIAQDYLAKIDGLLAGYDLKVRSERWVNEVRGLRDWLNRQNEAGEIVEVPDYIIDRANRTSWRELPLSELKDLTNSIRNIEALGKLKNKLISGQRQREFTATRQEVLNQIYASKNITNMPSMEVKNLQQKAISTVKKFNAAHLKVEFMIRALDNHKDMGPVWDAMFKPLVDADNRELALREQYGKMLLDNFNNHYDIKEQRNWKKDKMFIDELGESYTKEQLLSMALNMGNDTNIDRLQQGFRDYMGHELSRQDLQDILDKYLDKNDWHFVQDTWDMIDSLWPMIAKLQRELSGILPEKVEATPFTSKHGDFRGGYYPIKYDSEKSERAEAYTEQERIKSYFDTKAWKPQTSRGHLQERGKVGLGMLDLRLSVIDTHLTNVIHDLSFYKAIRDVDKLITDKEISGAIKAVLGQEMYDQFRPWLAAIGNDYKGPLNFIEKIMQRARLGTAVVNMGYKITTMLAQPFQAFQSIPRMGAGNVAGSILSFYGRFISDPVGGEAAWRQDWETIRSKSMFMRNRIDTYDRDVKDALTTMMKKKGYIDKIQESAFHLIGLSDMAVAVPLWLRAYDMHLADNPGDEAGAVHYADLMIRQTQSHGRTISLASVQRGHELTKMLTVFYSFFNTTYNLMASSVQEAGFMKQNGESWMPKLVASAVWIWFAPAILSELAARRGPIDWGDKDEWMKWTFQKLMSYPASSMVLLRDIWNPLIEGNDYNLTPVAEAFKTLVGSGSELWKVVTKSRDKDYVNLTKNLANATGYWFHIPTKQAAIVIQGMHDMITGKDGASPLDLLMPAPKKHHSK